MPFVSRSLKGRASIPGQAGTPSITSQDQGSVGLSWSAPAFTGGAPLTDYKLEYSTNGGSSWSTYSHAAGWATSVTATGLADFLTYIWKVSAINAVGTGAASANSAGAAQFNAATGGTESTVSNYNGTGQTWKTHVFSGNDTLAVTRGQWSFSTLVVGGGGGGGYAHSQTAGGGGGGGGQVVSQSRTLSNGNHSITMGTGGGTNPTEYASGYSGGTTTFSGTSATGGGGGGFAAGIGGEAYCCNGSAVPSGGTSSTIKGSAFTYGQTGSPGAPQFEGPNGAYPGGGGRGGGCGWGTGGNPQSGENGQVVVAYRIA